MPTWKEIPLIDQGSVDISDNVGGGDVNIKINNSHYELGSEDESSSLIFQHTILRF